MKKIAIVCLLLVSVLSISGQVKYEVTGVCDKHVEMVYLNSFSDYSQPDSVVPVDGHFSFTGVTNEACKFFTVFADYDQMAFIADGSPVFLNMCSHTLEGSALNKKFNDYEHRVKQISDSIVLIRREIRYLAKDESKRGELKEAVNVFDELYKRLENIYLKAIKDNQDNVIPAVYIAQLAKDMSYEQLKPFLDSSKPYFYSSVLNAAKAKVEAYERTIPGKMFVDLVRQKDLTGISHKLSDYVGKGSYVLVDFWASWCAPCMKEMPNVKACYDKYHSKGFNVVGISFDDNLDSWDAAIKRLNLDWINLSDLKGWENEAATVYGISAVPANILFDPEGKIVVTNLRDAKLRDKLIEIYGF